MAVDPLIKRIIVDPPAKGVPSSGLRFLCGLTFVAYVGSVLYAKHVAPQAVQDRIRAEMFTTPAPSSGH